MAVCSSCSAQLQPSWKFCIQCGVPVPLSAATAGVPGAIRPPAPVVSGPPPASPVVVFAVILSGLVGVVGIIAAIAITAANVG